VDSSPTAAQKLEHAAAASVGYLRVGLPDEPRAAPALLIRTIVSPEGRGFAYLLAQLPKLGNAPLPAGVGLLGGAFECT
jgi:hypothetical protein